MAGSTSRSYPWTRTKVDVALSALLMVTREGKDDCFMEDKIARTVSTLNSKNEFNWDPSGRVLTTEDLRALLYERHDCYHRVCAIADVPDCMGFSRRDYKILMTREQYVNHIQVSRDVLNANASFMNPGIELLCCCFVVAHPEDAEFINKDIPHFLGMYILFGRGCTPVGAKGETGEWGSLMEEEKPRKVPRREE